jgi:hypothetical protein
MLEGLQKPVIITGSQIPLCEVRNDARENLITSATRALAPRRLVSTGPSDQNHRWIVPANRCVCAAEWSKTGSPQKRNGKDPTCVLLNWHSSLR